VFFVQQTRWSNWVQFPWADPAPRYAAWFQKFSVADQDEQGALGTVRGERATDIRGTIAVPPRLGKQRRTASIVISSPGRGALRDICEVAFSRHGRKWGRSRSGRSSSETPLPLVLSKGYRKKCGEVSPSAVGYSVRSWRTVSWRRTCWPIFTSGYSRSREFLPFMRYVVA